METDIHLLSYVSQLFLEREMFQKNAVEKIKTSIFCTIVFFFQYSFH
jgi:hypothetical protein